MAKKTPTIAETVDEYLRGFRDDYYSSLKGSILFDEIKKIPVQNKDDFSRPKPATIPLVLSSDQINPYQRKNPHEVPLMPHEQIVNEETFNPFRTVTGIAGNTIFTKDGVYEVDNSAGFTVGTVFDVKFARRLPVEQPAAQTFSSQALLNEVHNKQKALNRQIEEAIFWGEKRARIKKSKNGS